MKPDADAASNRRKEMADAMRKIPMSSLDNAAVLYRIGYLMGLGEWKMNTSTKTIKDYQTKDAFVLGQEDGRGDYDTSFSSDSS